MKDKCCVVCVCNPYDSAVDYSIKYSKKFENVHDAIMYITSHFYSVINSEHHVKYPIGDYTFTRILVK